jgi:hypothetical protein
MSKVLLELSVSLDGFVAGPDIGHEAPSGRGGERLNHRPAEQRPGARLHAIASAASSVGGPRLSRRLHRHSRPGPPILLSLPPAPSRGLLTLAEMLVIELDLNRSVHHPLTSVSSHPIRALSSEGRRPKRVSARGRPCGAGRSAR